MQSRFSLFTSKVAKRIFLLFLLCAMLPITVFCVLTLLQTSSQLKEQSMMRLQSTAKIYGLGIMERFTYLETDLDFFSSTYLLSITENGKLPSPAAFGDTLRQHFSALFLIYGPDNMIQFMGKRKIPDTILLQLTTGKAPERPSVYFCEKTGTSTRVFMGKAVQDGAGNPGVLVGEVNTVYLWGIGHGNTLPPMTEVCVLDHTRNELVSSFHMPKEVQQKIRFDSASLETRSLEYKSDEENFFIGYWPLFLKSKFEGSNLIVALRNTHESVFAPLSSFKMLFSLVALLAFWIVLFLSAVSIRKSLVPLNKLKEGAIRLAHREFDTRVMITSGDEFETLADIFNESAAHIGRHFHAMEAMGEIDRAILSSLSRQTIVTTSLKRMCTFFSCTAVSFGLIHPRQPGTIHTFFLIPEKDDKIHQEFLSLTPDDTKAIPPNHHHGLVDVHTTKPSFIPSNLRGEPMQFLLLPLYLNKTTTGIICLGHSRAHPYSDDDLAHAKRLSNQVSVALSNARLVEELELLNWGALEALARTVDAKSKWTAGHSERAAELSVKIARVMGCDDKMVDTLHRAAFLHDIGKIGISRLILDKPDKLTDEEYASIKEHPVIGAKILEPIEAYADTIPIIIQHHERFDGKGYPYGLSGEDLSLGARILAVADVYDALISNRPYRQGWVEEKVIQLIVEESGKQFDPQVVDAFLSAVSWSIDGILNGNNLASP